ncbi:hypothetical protein G7B11_29410, partial [Klebsiella pneumoniae]|nr:hypothetical protein [Klebsiella pneumoniae]
LLDDDGIRAAITGSWLAQMGWETARLSALSTSPAAERARRPAGAGDRPLRQRTRGAHCRCWMTMASGRR